MSETILIWAGAERASEDHRLHWWFMDNDGEQRRICDQEPWGRQWEPCIEHHHENCSDCVATYALASLPPAPYLQIAYLEPVGEETR